MLIFIDESGNFTMPTLRKRNLCCVGALTVPETVHDDLVCNFVKLRTSWGGSQHEVKGNTLNEEQTAETISLLTNLSFLNTEN